MVDVLEQELSQSSKMPYDESNVNPKLDKCFVVVWLGVGF